MRILLTEDDDSVRSFVSRALELDGHKVDTACDGVEALERLTENDGGYDLLVSDVKMEGAEQRAQLSALAFDLGTRYVLFPPLQQPVIEDLVAGLMAATVRRVVGAAAGDDDA